MCCQQLLRRRVENNEKYPRSVLLIYDIFTCRVRSRPNPTIRLFKLNTVFIKQERTVVFTVRSALFLGVARLNKPQNILIHTQFILFVQDIVAHVLIQQTAHIGVADVFHQPHCLNKLLLRQRAGVVRA